MIKVCAWHVQNKRADVTHGICPVCRVKQMAKGDELHLQEALQLFDVKDSGGYLPTLTRGPWSVCAECGAELSPTRWVRGWYVWHAERGRVFGGDLETCLDYVLDN